MNKKKKNLFQKHFILMILIMFFGFIIKAQTPSPTPQTDPSAFRDSKEVVSILTKLIEETSKAQEKLKEAKLLVSPEKNALLLVRQKYNEAITIFRTVSRQVFDESLKIKISQTGKDSHQFQNIQTRIAFLANSGEAKALEETALTYLVFKEWNFYIAHLKSAAEVYQKIFTDKNNLDGNVINNNQLFLIKQARADCYEKIGATLLTIFGRINEAIAYGQQALEFYATLFQETQEPDYKIKQALVLTNLGFAYGRQAKHRTIAIETLNKSLEIYRSFPGEKRRAAEVLSVVAKLYMLQLDFAITLRSLDDALNIYRQLNDKRGQSQILESIAEVYWILNNQSKVTEYIKQNISILQSPDFAANWKQTLSPALTGQIGWNEEIDSFIQFQRLTGIGNSYLLLEDFDKSLEYYEKALLIAQARKQFANFSENLLKTGLGNVAYTFAKLKKWNQATEYYQKVLEISRKVGTRDEIALDLQNVGWTKLEAGNPGEALPYLSESLTIYQSIGIAEGKEFSMAFSPLLNLLSRAHYSLGNRQLSIFFGKRGVNAIQNERTRLQNLDSVFQKGFLEIKENHYRRLADWLIEEGRIIEAEQVLVLLKEEETFEYLRRDDKVAKELLQTLTLSDKEREALKRYDELAGKIAAIGKEFGELDAERKNYEEGKFPKQARYDELEKQLADANLAFQKFLEKLKVEFANTKKSEEIAKVDSGLQATLRDIAEQQAAKKQKVNRVAVVSTIVGENRLNIIFTTADTQRAHRVEISEKDLNKLVADFRQGLTKPKFDPRPAGQKLYDILVKPVEEDLKGSQTDTILWSLDGTLRYLPTAALWDKEKGYLVERFATVVLTLASHTKLVQETTNKANLKGLGVGVSKATEDFEALRAVPDELDCVITDPQTKNVSENPICQNGVLNGKKLLNEKFTLSAFKDSLGRYSIVHIASHFKLVAGNDRDSFLLLGGGEQRRYTVEELFKARLNGIELFVLSACNTATPGGSKTNGVEIEGFGAVAQKQGAKAVIATLWSVQDDSTREWMINFYKLYGFENISKAEAIRQTQLAMIYGKNKPADGSTKQRGEVIHLDGASLPEFKKDAKAPFAHPFYWSPFILIGNWR